MRVSTRLALVLAGLLAAAPGRRPEDSRQGPGPAVPGLAEPRRLPHPAGREGRLPEARERPGPGRVRRDVLETARPDAGHARERVQGGDPQERFKYVQRVLRTEHDPRGLEDRHGAHPHDPRPAGERRALRGHDRPRPLHLLELLRRRAARTCRRSSSCSSTSGAASASSSSTIRSRTARPGSSSTSGTSTTPSTTSSLYEKIKDLAPTLAEVAITRIPGEYNYDLSPSPRNAILLADILESPKKDVNPSYATHFLDYKGLVSTEYLTNYVECTTRRPSSRTRSRACASSISPWSRPTSTSTTTRRRASSTATSRSTSASGAATTIVFQYSREFPLYFPEDSWDRVKANGLAVEESFPVAEGQVQAERPADEHGRQAVQPPRGGPGGPAGQDRARRSRARSSATSTRPTARRPHPVQGPRQEARRRPQEDLRPRPTASPSSSASLNSDRRPWPRAARRGSRSAASGKPTRSARPTRSSSTPRAPGTILSIPYTIPAGDLEPDYYEVDVSLVGAGRRGHRREEGHAHGLAGPAVGHPIANAKGIPLANQFLFRYMLAEQLEKTDRPEAAAGLLRGSLPAPPGIRGRGRPLRELPQQDRGFRRGPQARRGPPRGRQAEVRPPRHPRPGAVRPGEDTRRPLADLDQANRVYNSDTAVLNALGTCYQKLGRRADALEAFNASLKLNPDQPEIKKIVSASAKCPINHDELTGSKGENRAGAPRGPDGLTSLAGSVSMGPSGIGKTP